MPHGNAITVIKFIKEIFYHIIALYVTMIYVILAIINIAINFILETLYFFMKMKIHFKKIVFVLVQIVI